jgi:hypothetical protein
MRSKPIESWSQASLLEGTSAMLGSSGGVAEFDDPALGNAKESSSVQGLMVKRNRPSWLKKHCFQSINYDDCTKA